MRKGEQWGIPVTGPPDASGSGDDADLAYLVAAHPGARLRFVPGDSSDLARAVGLTSASSGATELPLDALRVDDGTLAVNMVVLGAPPDRLSFRHRACHASVTVDGRSFYEGPATTVVVANGQFLRGTDLVPRGHPGDARAEVQVYALDRAERSRMRTRLRTATHLPHPDIKTTTGRTIQVTWSSAASLDLDGHRGAPTKNLTVRVEPAAYRLVV